MLMNLILFVGCGGSDSPYPMGLKVNLSATVDEVTVSYRMNEGDDAPTEAVTLYGSGTAQEIAAYPGRTQSITTTGEEQIRLEVVGTTPINHPLVPNEQEYSERLASIVQKRSRTAASIYTVQEVYDPYNEEVQFYKAEEYIDKEIKTSFEYYAVAVDEYAVRFPIENMWIDFEEDVEISDVDLLTKNDPQPDEVWSSTNGNTLYYYLGEQEMALGGEQYQSKKIAMYEATNLQAEGAEVYEQCLYQGKFQLTSDNQQLELFDNSTLQLDTGCEGDFTHSRVGTQWWVNNILVKEESTIKEINIRDYGYEWFEQDEETGEWQRLTSRTLTDAAIGAKGFIEYDLTERIYTLKTDKWTLPK